MQPDKMPGSPLNSQHWNEILSGTSDNAQRVRDFFVLDRPYRVLSSAGNFYKLTLHARLDNGFIFSDDGTLIYLPNHAIVSITPWVEKLEPDL